MRVSFITGPLLLASAALGGQIAKRDNKDAPYAVVQPPVFDDAKGRKAWEQTCQAVGGAQIVWNRSPIESIYYARCFSLIAGQLDDKTKPTIEFLQKFGWTLWKL